MLAGTVICLSTQNERRVRVFLEVENSIKKPVRGLKGNIFRLLSWLMSAFYAFFSDILPVVFWYSKESIIKSVTVLAALTASFACLRILTCR